MEYELKALEGAGIPFKRDDKAFDEGKLILELCPTVEGKAVKLIAQFPDLYPYFRFELFAPDLALKHHQNPFLKNLCLIERATHNWFVDDTLARFIVERLPDVLMAGRSENVAEVSEKEIHQGEPISDYYSYRPAGAVLVDSAWKVREGLASGKILVGVDLSPHLVRGAVLKVFGPKDEILARAADPVRELFRNQLMGTWVRLDSPILAPDPGNFAADLLKRVPSLRDSRWGMLNGYKFNVIGVLFPEEVVYREKRIGWIFLIRMRSVRNARQFVSATYLVRACRSGRSDVLARAPELGSLSQKKIALFGLGCVGAPSAIELARTGAGELRVLDKDFVDPATAVRWPLGLGYAGMAKTEAVREFIATNFPYTKVRPYPHHLGAALDGKRSDLDVLEEVLDGADLVYDATAEVGVQHFLSDLARKRGIPYVMVQATTGGWGGLIARFVPGLTEGCWSCLQGALKDQAIPPPPEKPEEPIQPLGCASPTFTGAGFDISQVSLGGVRTAISLLCRQTENGYPLFDWDVGVLSLRKKDGEPIAPRWETFRLRRSPSCESCKKVE